MWACTRSNLFSLRSLRTPRAYAGLTRRLTSRSVSGRNGTPASCSRSASPPATEQATSTSWPLRRNAAARSTTCRSAPPTSSESTTSSSRSGFSVAGRTESTIVLRLPLLVVVEAEVGYEVLALYGAQGVLQLHQLDKEVVLGVELGQHHRAIEVEREPLLDAPHPRAPREVQKERQVEDQGGREDGVAAQEVYLDLHRVAEPAEDVYVVPALLGVAAGRVVVDLDQVRDVAVELGVELGLQDTAEHRELADLLALEAFRVVEYLPVPISQDVGRVPALQPEHARLEAGGDDGLHQGLPRLEVLARNRDAPLVREPGQSRHVHGERGRAVGVRDALHDRGVGVDHGRRDRRVGPIQRFLEPLQREVRLLRLQVGLRGGAGDHDRPLQAVPLLEGADVLAHQLGGLAQGGVSLGVGGDKPRDVARVEDGGEGLHGLELVAHGVEVLLLEHPGDRRGLVGVVREGVPAAEDQVARAVERHELLYLRHPVLGALPEPDRAELCQRTYRLGETPLYELDPGDKGGRHRTHPRHQDPEPAPRDPYIPGLGHL